MEEATHMAEIKEFKTNTPKQPQADHSGDYVSNVSGMQVLTNLLRHPKAPLVSMIVFAAAFLLDLYLMVHFTFTSITACCILLVIQALLAVCLDRLNYAGLLGIALAEVIIGALFHNFLLSILCLIPYFMALLVIHIQRLHGGLKTA